MTDEQDIDEAPEPLPERQRRFVDAYMGEAKGNGKRAAQLAGYAGDENVLAVQACVLLRKPKIRQAIDARIDSDELAMKRMERVHMLSRIGRGEYTETRFDNNGNPYDVQPTAKDIIAAIRELGLLQGDYVQKVAQTNAAGEDVQNMSDAQLLALAAAGKGE